MTPDNKPIQVILVSSPTDEPKRLILGLSLAAAAAAAGTEVRIFLAMDAAQCLSSDVCRRELVAGYPPAAELLAVIRESGGLVEYCPHCLPSGCDATLAHAANQHDRLCGCGALPAGLSSYGVRLADYPTVVF